MVLLIEKLYRNGSLHNSICTGSLLWVKDQDFFCKSTFLLVKLKLRNVWWNKCAQGLDCIARRYFYFAEDFLLSFCPCDNYENG